MAKRNLKKNWSVLLILLIIVGFALFSNLSQTALPGFGEFQTSTTSIIADQPQYQDILYAVGGGSSYSRQSVDPLGSNGTFSYHIETQIGERDQPIYDRTLRDELWTPYSIEIGGDAVIGWQTGSPVNGILNIYNKTGQCRYYEYTVSRIGLPQGVPAQPRGKVACDIEGNYRCELPDNFVGEIVNGDCGVRMAQSVTVQFRVLRQGVECLVNADCGSDSFIGYTCQGSLLSARLERPICSGNVCTTTEAIGEQRACANGCTETPEPMCQEATNPSNQSNGNETNPANPNNPSLPQSPSQGINIQFFIFAIGLPLLLVIIFVAMIRRKR